MKDSSVTRTSRDTRLIEETKEQRVARDFDRHHNATKQGPHLSTRETGRKRKRSRRQTRKKVTQKEEREEKEMRGESSRTGK